MMKLRHVLILTLFVAFTAHGVEIDVDAYALSGQVDWKARTIKMAVAITFSWPDDKRASVEFDSQVAQIFSVYEKGGKALTYKLTPGSLTVFFEGLSDKARKEKAATIEVSYQPQITSNTNGDAAALQLISERKGDPNHSKIAYTSSEPLGTAEWMPCHNTPADRAIFSVDFLLSEGESLIANGDIVSNAKEGKRRRVRYMTAYTLPTYLMAFAVGELENTTKKHGKLPISIWRRKGVIGNWNSLIAETIRQMDRMEELLTPYPFEKYAVVLVPEYPSGGMENAGISFIGEHRFNYGNLQSDRSIAAHELAHQWFGDLVTVSDWDSLWVKEGMATLLTEEIRRPYEDKNKAMRMFGRNYLIEDGYAIYEPKRPAGEKYHTGVYGRAAWLYTQIRALQGEENFWKILREVLQNKNMKSISGEEMIQALNRHMGPGFCERYRRSAQTEYLPTLDFSGGKIKLKDSGKALFFPILVEWLTKSGTKGRAIVEKGIDAEIPTEATFVIFDSKEVHPLPYFERTPAFEHFESTKLIPRTEKAFEMLLQASGAAQLAALSVEEQKWNWTPTQFSSFFKRLSSDKAKVLAIARACESSEDKPAAWKSVVQEAIRQRPTLGLLSRGIHDGLSSCMKLLGDSMSKPNQKDEIEFTWSSAFAATPENTLAWWGPLSKSGKDLRTRLMAINQLAKHVQSKGEYAPPKGATEENYKTFFREALEQNESWEVLAPVIDAIEELGDKDAVKQLSELLKNRDRVSVHRSAFCAIREILEEDKSEWVKILNWVRTEKSLTQNIKDLGKDPEGCDINPSDLGEDT